MNKLVSSFASKSNKHVLFEFPTERDKKGHKWTMDTDYTEKLFVKAANNRCLARSTTSVLTGFPLSLGHRKIIDPKTGREVNVFDTLSEYYDLIKSRKSKGEKDKALKEFFKEHPYIREYLNYKKLGNDAGNQIKVATATSLKYDGMDKLFIDKLTPGAIIPPL